MTIAADANVRDESLAFNESRRLLPRRIALTTSIAYAKGARHTLDVCRPQIRDRGAGHRLLLWRRLAQRQQADLPLCGQGAGAARLCRRAAGLSHLSAGALSGFPRRRRAGGALGEGQRQALRRRSAKNLPDGPFGRRPYRGHAGDRRHVAAKGRPRARPRYRRPDRRLRSVRFPAAQGRNAEDHLRRRQPAGNAADLPRHAGRAAGAVVDRRQGRRGRRRQFHASRRTAARRGQRRDGGDLSAHRALHHRRRDRAHHPVAGSGSARYRCLHRQGAEVAARRSAGVS